MKRMMMPRYQYGYMDNQVMPAMFGAVLLFVVLGQVTPEALAEGGISLKLWMLMPGATLVLLYGFVMHIYALNYPESPFNKHTSPLFMNLICGGILGFAAWRFHGAGVQAGMWIYALLCFLVLSTSVAFNMLLQKALDEEE